MDIPGYTSIYLDKLDTPGIHTYVPEIHVDIHGRAEHTWICLEYTWIYLDIPGYTYLDELDILQTDNLPPFIVGDVDDYDEDDEDDDDDDEMK